MELTGLTHEDILDVIGASTQDKIKYDAKYYFAKAKEKEDMKKLFGSFFNVGEICVLAGKTGQGKTVLAYQIAIGLARGEDILNEPNEVNKQGVLFLDFELNYSHIKKRFRNFEPPDNFYRPDMNEILIKYGQVDIETIKQMIQEANEEAKEKGTLPVSVLVLDNLSAISLKSLQDQTEALNIMRELKILNLEHNISILVVAHTPKIKEDRPLEIYDIAGAAHIVNFCDSAMVINSSKKGANVRYIKQIKGRNVPDTGDVLVVKLVDEDWLHYEAIGYEKEEEQLNVNLALEERTKNELIDIARQCFDGHSSMSYTALCNKYMEITQKTEASAKKAIRKMRMYDIIVKDGKSYWFNSDLNSKSFKDEDENGNENTNEDIILF